MRVVFVFRQNRDCELVGSFDHFKCIKKYDVFHIAFQI
jgi:hypothetical protein